MDRSTELELELELGVELPLHFEKYDVVVQQLIIQYIKQLNTIEKLAYKIGKQHLGSSFNVVKSNGYNTWLKKQK
jgi:hypothetical protein